jgi:hypothetical protein
MEHFPTGGLGGIQRHGDAERIQRRRRIVVRGVIGLEHRRPIEGTRDADRIVPGQQPFTLSTVSQSQGRTELGRLGLIEDLLDLLREAAPPGWFRISESTHEEPGEPPDRLSPREVSARTRSATARTKIGELNDNVRSKSQGRPTMD